MTAYRDITSLVRPPPAELGRSAARRGNVMKTGRLIWILMGCGLGVLLGALLGGYLLSQWAPGPGEGGDKFGANVVIAGLGGAFLGGVAGGIVGGTLGN